MNNEEAKFILRAGRPDGRDSSDPLFQEAVAAADRDPGLARWWARERDFDRAVAARLEGIAPPRDLRDAILIGARASRPRRLWWRSPMAFAAAAAVVAAVAIPVVFREPGAGPATVAAPAIASGADLARYAMANVRDGPHGHPTDPGASAIEAALATSSGTVRVGFDLSAETFRRAGCQHFDFGGHDVYEVCFRRDGAWFHLFVTRRPDGPVLAGPAGPEFFEGEGVASAAWADDEHFYSLVTRAGAAALHPMI